MIDVVFDVSTPKAADNGRSYILQGPVGPNVDIIKVVKITVVDGEQQNEERLIPKARFQSNKGLRWWTEFDVEPGETKFEVYAGQIQTGLSGTLLTPSGETLIGNKEFDLYFDDVETRMGDGGYWTDAGEEGLVGFEIEYAEDKHTVSPEGPTTFYRMNFTVPSYMTIASAVLKLSHSESAEAYIDGLSVYSLNMGADWEYSDAGVYTAYAQYQQAITLDAGDHILAIAQKSSIGSPLQLAAQIDVEFSQTVYSDPKQIVINRKTTEVTEFNHFNDLDEWGLLLGVDRLPRESNSKYKRRLQQYVRSGFGSTTRGILSGGSARLNLPIVDDALTITLADKEFSRQRQPVFDDLTISIHDGQLVVRSSGLNQAETLQPQEGYDRLVPSGTINQIRSLYGRSQGEIDGWRYEVRSDGLYILDNPDPLGYDLDYTYQLELPLKDKNILEVCTWFNRVTASGMNASGELASIIPFDASPAPDINFLIYSGQYVAGGLTSGSRIVTVSGSGSLEFQNERDLFFNNTGEEEYYGVDQMWADKIRLDEAYAGSSPSGAADYRLVKAPLAEFIPDGVYKPRDTGSSYRIKLPLYQWQFRPLIQSDWDEYNNIDGDGKIAKWVDEVSSSIRSAWGEVVADEDVWQAASNGKAGGGRIPNIYDGPKSLYKANGGDTYYTPREAYALDYKDPSSYRSVLVEVREVSGSYVTVYGDYAPGFIGGWLTKVDENGYPTTPEISHAITSAEQIAGLDSWLRPTYDTKFLMDTVTDITAGDTWELRIIEDNELLPILFKPTDWKSGVDNRKEYMKVVEAEEVVTASGALYANHVQLTPLWKHQTFDWKDGLGIGYYHEAVWSRTDPNYGIEDSTTNLTVIQPGSDIEFYVALRDATAATSVEWFSDNSLNRDFKSHIVGIPYSDELKERLDMAAVGTDSYIMDAIKQLVIDYAQRQLVTYGFGLTDTLLFINVADGQDVLSDGPHLVVRLQDV